MRFPQLPFGARFEYQGKVYSKTGALLASAEDGSGQRIIPKYADLKPTDGNSKTPSLSPQRATVDMGAVRAAIEAHHAACRNLLLQAAKDPTQIEATLASLESTHQYLLAALDDASAS